MFSRNDVHLSVESADLRYVQMQMAIFLKISLSNFLSVFAARTTGYCWERVPGTLMSVCVVGALIISTILAMHWPFADGLTSISILVTIYVWFYVLFWLAVQVRNRDVPVRLPCKITVF